MSDSTDNPLNNFITAAQNGVGAINSALATQSSSSSSTSSSAAATTTSSAAAATSSTASKGGLSNGARTGIIVGVVLGVVLILGIVLGICCCLCLRRRRRRKRVNAATDPTAHETTERQSAPLMAAVNGRHDARLSQAPSLSQHPALRQSPHENPFSDSAHATQDPPRYSHHGLDHGHGNGHSHGHGPGLAGAAAVGAAAGYGVHKHRQSNESNRAKRSSPLSSHSQGYHPVHPPLPTKHAETPNVPHGHTQTTTTTSRRSGDHHPMSSVTHTQGVHHGLPPALAAGALASSNRHSPHRPESGDHTAHPLVSRKSVPPSSHTGFPPTAMESDRRELPQYHETGQQPISATNAGTNDPNYHAFSGAPASRSHDHSPATHDGLTTLPSARHSPHVTPKEAIAGGAAFAALQHQEKRRRRESSGSRSTSRSRSRSHSRHRSSLPTHNNEERPPTPFGLGSIGQPYDDKHVSVLQSQPPSDELRRSLQGREDMSTGNAEEPRAPGLTHQKGHSTPPQIPSRSPNRDSRASAVRDSSYESSVDNTTSSNSGESYNAMNDPYKPATPNRNFLPPWERHQNRYSTTPPASAGVQPPPVPWQDNDATPQQRRHSPRVSLDGDGRRKSRSPATGINGQQRRLRFEDLQSNEHLQGATGNNQEYEAYDAAAWSPNVGKAL